MRVIFFGTGAFGAPSLEALARGHTVAGCVTQPDRPRGRGLHVAASPVKEAAVRLGLTVLQPTAPDPETVRSLAPEIGVVVDYGRILTEAVLAVPPHGILGAHPSLLPKFRGASPVASAILAGAQETGVTIFRLSARMDAGDILSQRRAPIEPRDTVDRLAARLAGLAADELLRALDAVGAGRVLFRPQDEAQATVTEKLTKAHGRIDWRQPAQVIDRQIRAMGAWPGAATTLNGAGLKLHQAAALPEGASGGAPGTVVRVGPDGLEVATGRGTLLVQELQPAGRRRMSVREFLAGHPVRAGDTFGP
jgi:methionyl-tRNA formyltransferase